MRLLLRLSLLLLLLLLLLPWLLLLLLRLLLPPLLPILLLPEVAEASFAPAALAITTARALALPGLRSRSHRRHMLLEQILLLSESHCRLGLVFREKAS